MPAGSGTPPISATLARRRVGVDGGVPARRPTAYTSIAIGPVVSNFAAVITPPVAALLHSIAVLASVLWDRTSAVMTPLAHRITVLVPTLVGRIPAVMTLRADRIAKLVPTLVGRVPAVMTPLSHCITVLVPTFVSRIPAVMTPLAHRITVLVAKILSVFGAALDSPLAPLGPTIPYFVAMLEPLGPPLDATGQFFVKLPAPFLGHTATNLLDPLVMKHAQTLLKGVKLSHPIRRIAPFGDLPQLAEPRQAMSVLALHMTCLLRPLLCAQLR